MTQLMVHSRNGALIALETHYSDDRDDHAFHPSPPTPREPAVALFAARAIPQKLTRPSRGPSQSPSTLTRGVVLGGMSMLINPHTYSMSGPIDKKQHRHQHRNTALLFLTSLVPLLLLLIPQPAHGQAQAPIQLVAAPSIRQIDNELLADPVVECEEAMVKLSFKTRKPFTGRIYVLGLADDERCSRNFATNTDQSKLSMMIHNGDCAMQRQRVTGTLEGMMLSLTVVVSFHGTFVTKSDRAYKCMCFFKNIKHLSSAIDVNLIGTTEIIDTAKTPTCHYSIHSQSPDGPPVGTGRVGDRIFHVWECDADTHGFLVHTCSVDDGRGAKFDLLDIDGCAIDPIIQPDVIYDTERNRASVETFGYKFSDTSLLNYHCTIELCKKEANECQGLTPPICGRQLTAAIKKKRETSEATTTNNEGHPKPGGEVAFNLTESEASPGETKSRLDSGSVDLWATLRMLDSVYNNIGQLAMVGGRPKPLLSTGGGVSELTPGAVVGDEEYWRREAVWNVDNSGGELAANVEPKREAAAEGSERTTGARLTKGDVGEKLTTHSDCLRSMLLGFMASVFIAVTLVVSIALLVVRRSGDSSGVKFV